MIGPDDILRDLISRTAPAPLPADYDRDPAGPPVLPPPVRAKFGTARIAANSGGGAYTVTETADDDGALTLMSAPDGFVGRLAYAINGSSAWEVGDDVLYMQVPTVGGAYVLYIERGPGPVTLDTSVGFCGLHNYRIDASGRIIATEVATGGSPAYKWVDNEGNDI